ncbi:MAG: hypothetical protein AB8B84_06640 [Granulosicoccus sp.]
MIVKVTPIAFLLLASCSSNAPTTDVSYTGGVWTESSIELRFVRVLDATSFDTGLFIDYDKTFVVGEFTDEVAERLERLETSFPPDVFPTCEPRGTQPFYNIEVTNMNGSVRHYVDEFACNLDLWPDFTQPEEVIGILDQIVLDELFPIFISIKPR